MFYKYLGTEKHHLDVIKNLRIRFSQPSALNDPFEAVPLIIHSLKPEEQNLQKNGKDLIEQQLIGIIGILSLSRTKRNQLLWSHNANEHKGYVIGFDENHDFFNSKSQDAITHPLNVLYTTERPIIDAPDNKFWYEHHAFEHQYLSKILGQKPIDWAYEEEVRLFAKLVMLEQSISDEDNLPVFDKNNLPVYLIRIPKDSITGVYFGVKTTQKTKQDIKSHCKQNDLNVPIYESFLSKENYSIEFIECEY